MSDRRYKSVFPFWTSPYYNSFYPESVTDEQIEKHTSKALVIDRRDRTRSPTKANEKRQNHKQQESTLSVRARCLKREITQEICEQLLGSVDICIPIPAVSALPNRKKQSKSNKKKNEQLIKLQKDMQEMKTKAEQLDKLKEDIHEAKTKAEQQDELIQHLRKQLEEKAALPSTPILAPTPPKKSIGTTIPTMPYAEDPPSIDLSETIWG